MKRERYVCLFGIFLSAFFLLNSSLCHAEGFFQDLKMYFKERHEIKAHSENVITEVKSLYKHKDSIRKFIDSVTELRKSYNAISNKKASILAVVNIATSIDSLVREFQFLSPKAENFYRKVQPDLKYFSKLDGDGDANSLTPEQTQKVLLKTFSDKRIEKLSGSVGWGRVFDAVKDNPINIFKWGRLKDEYRYGKTEGMYALKTAQIGFEATAYYLSAKNAMNDLLGLRQEIDGIVSGDWKAILGMGDTIDKIQGAGSSVERLSNLISQAGTHFGKRIKEFETRQNEFVSERNSYRQKYENTGEKKVNTPSVPAGNSANVNFPSRKKNPYSDNTSFGIPTGSRDIQEAMRTYQKAYQNYTAIMQNPRAGDQDRNRAIEALRVSRERYESLKAAFSK